MDTLIFKLTVDLVTKKMVQKQFFAKRKIRLRKKNFLMLLHTFNVSKLGHIQHLQTASASSYEKNDPETFFKEERLDYERKIF